MFKNRLDQCLLLDYQKDHQLRLLDKFFLESQIVHGGDNVPDN